LKIAYGYTIEEKDDPFVRNAEISGANFAKSTTPGWLVDLLPFCALLFLYHSITVDCAHFAAFGPIFTSAASPGLDTWRNVPPSSRGVEERNGLHV